MKQEEQEVLAAADYEVRMAQLEAQFPGEYPKPWEPREGEALSVTDYRSLPAGSNEREMVLFDAVNDLWNMVEGLQRMVGHIAQMVHHVENHLPCAGELPE